ncbi:hypothetical protein Tco_0663351 [Tanacetum coccineum]
MPLQQTFKSSMTWLRPHPTRLGGHDEVRANLQSRPLKQTSGADLRSRPSEGGTRGRRSCNNLQSSRSRTTFLLSAEEPKETLPKEPPPKEPMLNHTILTFKARLPSPSGPHNYASTLAPSVGLGFPIYTN